MNLLFKKCKNPLVEDNLKNRFYEWICKTHKGFKNCIKTGSYYGMPQAWCGRCGHKNWCASSFVPEWSIPDRLETKR